MRHFWKSEAGVAAIEAALVLPVFLLLLFGIIEFGRLFWASHALQETATVTARCMGLPQLECSRNGTYDAALASEFAKNTSRGWFIALDPASIALDRDAECQGIGGFSSVALAYEFQTVVPKLIEALAGGTALKATACYPNQ
ncbi:TadE/TadG family type IV pilus assembly protein [Brucella endophytica]|uniref:TadE/TadG family type IV pilus assembly protein n=1 Tax=Brucella endophytica TaxID=1963359 RepID=UPI0035BC0B52